MAKSRKISDLHKANQASIFSLKNPFLPEDRIGCLGFEDEFRQVTAEAFKKCPLSRYEVAGKLSHLLGCEISKSMVDAWLAESKTSHRLPASYIPALCAVLGDITPLQFIASKIGISLLGNSAQINLEIDSLRQELRNLKFEIKRREKLLSLAGGFIVNPKDRLAIENLSANVALLAGDIRESRKMFERVFNIKNDVEESLYPNIPRKYAARNKILDHPEARSLFLKLYNEDVTYDEMTVRLNKIDGFTVSRSAIARLWQRVSRGEVELQGRNKN